jgi:hypothetical protein
MFLKKKLNSICSSNLFKTLFSVTTITALVLTPCVIAINALPARAADVEMLMGDEQVFVDSNGQSYGAVPNTISPEGFNPVIQPKISLPSNEVSKAFRAMRARKDKGGASFTIDPALFAGNSELTPRLVEALRRPQVLVSINQLQSKGNSRVNIARQRLQYYQTLFEKIFIAEGVPSELISIGFVESTYNPSAISPAGAKGMWQFIPSTGRIFGLVSNEDFQDPVKSTRAAAKYLKRLHGRFGDWLLAIAAYNAGDTRVQQAINMSNGNKDFWEVSRFLPNETRNYVPRVLAATTILGRGDLIAN